MFKTTSRDHFAEYFDETKGIYVRIKFINLIYKLCKSHASNMNEIV